MTTHQPLAVFDLDGTLNRTDLFSVPAHQQTLKEFGVPEETCTREFILSAYGMRWEDYMELFLPGRDLETKRQYIRRVSQLEDTSMKTLARYYDGIPEMLDALHQAGIQTAVCSNASVRYITAVLNALHLMDHIDHIQHLVDGLDKCATLKLLLEKVQPSKAVMVGDRIFDIEAARANRIPSVGCLYGFNPAEAEKADYAVRSVPELTPILLDLLKD